MQQLVESGPRFLQMISIVNLFSMILLSNKAFLTIIAKLIILHLYNISTERP